MRLSEQNNNSEKKDYKIIAVDDESGIIDSLSVFLKRSGYTLIGCADPLEAIERVKNEHFDLMLLDFIMSPRGVPCEFSDNIGRDFIGEERAIWT